MNAKAQKYIPLTEATYYILLSLVKPLHGYGIMQMVEEMTNGEVKLGPGTLYGNTTKLLKEKLIVEVASTDRKKCYELTPFGREVLELEYNRLQRSVRNGNSILGKVNERWRQRRYSNLSQYGA
ncbi:PadR family transcriptional regulator [Bacillus cereus]